MKEDCKSFSSSDVIAKSWNLPSGPGCKHAERYHAPSCPNKSCIQPMNQWEIVYLVVYIDGEDNSSAGFKFEYQQPIVPLTTKSYWCTRTWHDLGAWVNLTGGQNDQPRPPHATGERPDNNYYVDRRFTCRSFDFQIRTGTPPSGPNPDRWSLFGQKGRRS